MARGAATRRRDPAESVEPGIARPPGARETPVADTLLLLAALVVTWQLLSLLAGAEVLTSPLATIRRLGRLVADPDFPAHAVETASAFAVALAISLAGGLLLGAVLGAHRISGEVAEPLLVALYSIPKITLYPVVLLLFGLGMPAKIAFGAIHGIIPIALFTITSVRNIKPVLIKTGRVMGLTTWQMFRTILFPAAVPEIFTGLRIGFALTLIGTLLGEMFASQRGLGYLLKTAIGLHNVDQIMGVTFLLVVFAAIVSAVLIAIDRRLHARSAT